MEQGVLRQQDDIFHLTQDEVFGYLDGTGVTENLQGMADIRRKEFEVNRTGEAMVEVTTSGPVRQNSIRLDPAPHDDERTLRGLGSSTGKVRRSGPSR